MISGVALGLKRACAASLVKALMHGRATRPFRRSEVKGSSTQKPLAGPEMLVVHEFFAAPNMLAVPPVMEFAVARGIEHWYIEHWYLE